MNELKKEINKTIKAHPKTDSEFYVRWIITRGAGPIEMSCRHAGAEPTRYIIIVKPIPCIKDRYLNDRDGLRLKITQIRRNSEVSTNPQIKSGNYLNNVLALNEAKRAGFDDCLMLTGKHFWRKPEAQIQN